MSEEVLRRFRDKIHGRADGRPHPPAPATAGAPDTPQSAGDPEESGTIRIQVIDTGPFPAAASLNPRFPAGGPRLRLTMVPGAAWLKAMARPGPRERDRVLSLCPRLGDHDCADRPGLRSWLSEGGEDGSGLAAAHLVEHVALEVAAEAGGPGRYSGAACAWRGRAGWHDVFLDCPDAALGRAALLLAAAAVRDLPLSDDRTPVHRRSRDLLRALASDPRPVVAPEDFVPHHAPGPLEARAALHEIVRLGYLDPIPGAFTFSSATGTLFRRAGAAAR